MPASVDRCARWLFAGGLLFLGYNETMPSGIEHTTHTATLAVGIAGGIALGAALSGHISPAVAAWGLAGVVISPDMDIYPNITYTYIERIFGKPGRVAWEIIWRPYARIVPHRSLSHTPILGTLTRVVWLLMWLAALEISVRSVLYTLGFDIALTVPVLGATLRWLSSPDGLAAFAFLALSDTWHLVMDLTNTYAKRKW